jgi:hypothetical protein
MPSLRADDSKLLTKDTNPLEQKKFVCAKYAVRAGQMLGKESTIMYSVHTDTAALHSCISCVSSTAVSYGQPHSVRRAVNESLEQGFADQFETRNSAGCPQVFLILSFCPPWKEAMCTSSCFSR